LTDADVVGESSMRPSMAQHVYLVEIEKPILNVNESEIKLSREKLV
jgi:hypothetical protein